MLSFTTNGNFIDFTYTEDVIHHRYSEHLLMKLHNTSRCITWKYGEDTTRISFKVDELEYEDILISEIDFDGVAMTAQADFETGIAAMFSGYAAPGGTGYLSYVALLSQSGTDGPVAIVLYNTLGGTVVWTRTGTGDYRGTLNGVFTANKTFLPQPGNTAGVSSSVISYWISANAIGIASGLSVDGTLLDDTLFLTSVEFRVYP